jgi:hypothetical protein
MSDDLVQRLYAAFDPAHPLRADETDLYVELDDLRGAADVVHRMASKIRLSGGKPTCQVLAGHRGSGKTTELLRLKSELESNDPKMFVVFCQADDDIDRNDVDFPDLLVAVIRQMAAQVREREGITLKPGYFKDRLRHLGKVLTSEIDFDKFDLDTGLGKLGVTLKGSPDARSEIRKLMEPDTGNLLRAANDVISEAVLELDKKGFNGLVILVDDLDKMVVRSLDHAGCSSAEYLFVHRAAQLTGFSCHVIYSMPISLAYSHLENAIKTNYGGHVPVVPMTKTATKPPASKPHAPGIERFREIIEKRVKHAKARMKDLFANASMCDHLIGLSGGQPFELMTLVREAIITHGLPIDKESLARAEREGRREYARQLRSEHQPIIDEVRRTGRFSRTAEREALFRELLESRAVLQYVNDEEWYGLNPMVEALQPAKRTPPATRKKSGRTRRGR